MAGEPIGVVKAYLDWILIAGQAMVPILGFVPLRSVQTWRARKEGL